MSYKLRQHLGLVDYHDLQDFSGKNWKEGHVYRDYFSGVYYQARSLTGTWLLGNFAALSDVSDILGRRINPGRWKPSLSITVFRKTREVALGNLQVSFGMSDLPPVMAPRSQFMGDIWLTYGPLKVADGHYAHMPSEEARVAAMEVILDHVVAHVENTSLFYERIFQRNPA